MNKLFTKIVGAALGLTMAIGVGVAVASNSKEATPVQAAAGSLTVTASDLGYTNTTYSNKSGVAVGDEGFKFSTTDVCKQSGTSVKNFQLKKTSGYLWNSDCPSGYTITSIQLTNKSGGTVTVKKGSSAKPSTTVTAGSNNTYTINDKYFGISGPSAAAYFTLVINYSSGATKLDAPSPTFNDSTKKVTWDVDANASSYQVKVDSGSYATATTPYDVSGLTTGTSHTVYVVAKGDGTNYSDSDAGSVTFTPSAPRTVTGLEVLDDEANELSDGDEVPLTATGESISTDITCGVSYSTGSPDGAVNITSSPSTNFSVVTEDDETYTLTFSANGDYDVTIAAIDDSNYSITINYSVSGITALVWEKVTSVGALKSGSEIIIGNTDGSYVMAPYTGSGNNCPNVEATPNEDGNLPQADIGEGFAILTLGGSSGSWTLTDQNDLIYFGTSGQNYLKASSSATDTWSISIDSTSHEATITSTASSRWIAQNTSTKAFATYANSNQWEVAIYMLPSNDPEIEVDVTSGSTSLSVNGTATLTATLKNTTGTVAWSLVENTPTGTGNVVQISTDGNSVTVTGKKDGTVKVRAALAGCDNVDTLFTVTKALSSIAVTTAPSTTTYTEGQSFSTTGMVVTATYDDGSTSTPSDYTYSPNGALTPSDTTITISYGGKSTTQAITVNAKVVASIAVKTLPTKNSYHSGDSFESAGLEITVTYEGGSTADITSGFTISPATYTFTDADETAGSKTFTVSYSGKSTTFNVTVAAVTGPIASGRYYIMNSDKTYGLNAVAATSGSPTALDLSSSDNEMTAFDVTLKADNEYEISVTISETKYYLVCNTTATSSSNTSIRVTSSPASLKSLYWNLEDPAGETEGAYTVKENTTGTTYRYLACYSTTDWRGYLGASGDRDIQFVAENSYAESIADSLMNDITCNNGATAPSTSTWGSISTAYGNIPAAMKYEKALLTGGTADEESEDVIEQALARYDYIVGKYNKGQGITAYNDFLGRNPSPISNSRIILNSIVNNSGNTVAIIVIISMISVTVIGGYFFLRKRKEQ